ncbi:hypothetical protein P4V34_28810 [Bacillus thuringiensis]|nr:hypothetical protein [Bacillus thuringiensis]
MEIKGVDPVSKKERLEQLIRTLKSKGIKIDWAVRVTRDNTLLSETKN